MVDLPFIISAPSMVFGMDLLENVRLLTGLVDNIEIVLYHTPTLHNIPSRKEIRTLKRIGEDENVTFTVHLPSSLELASQDKKIRDESIKLLKELFSKMSEINPIHYILHIPFTPPTLAPVPGLYFTPGCQEKWDEWTKRALSSLELLHETMGRTNTILVENINYSPFYLESFLKNDFCDLCLDLGHLMLGQENVIEIIKEYLHVTKEIHLHGVKGNEEHLSLSILHKNLVQEWLKYLIKSCFKGVINLEVFDPKDLKSSLNVLTKAFLLFNPSFKSTLQ